MTLSWFIRRAMRPTNGRRPRAVAPARSHAGRRRAALALTASVLAGIAALSSVAPSPASAAPADQGTAGQPSVADVIPDVTLVLGGATVEQPDELAERLEALDGVARVAIDVDAEPDPIVHLAVSEAAGERRPAGSVIDLATDLIEQRLPGAEVAAGGAAVVDAELAAGFAATVRLLAVLAILVGAAIGWFDGWRRGLAVSVGLGVAVLAAGSIGDQAGGPFEGSMASTGLPAALAGLTVGAALAARLVVWFRRPVEGDGASRLQAAVRDLGAELVLLFAGLAAVSLVLEPLNPGRSAATVATVGAAVAAVVVLALIAPALALLDRQPATVSRPLQLDVRDGRHLPLPIVALGAAALLILSVAAFGRTGDDLLDVDDLDADAEPALVAEAQARRGGDPTSAIAVEAPGASSGDFAGWVALAAERPEVAWIELDQRRYTSAAETELAEWAALTPSGSTGALVVPSVSLRSDEGQELTAQLAGLPLAGAEPRFIGPGAETDGVAGSRTAVLVAIAGLAVAAALAAQALTGNRALALLSLLLRLLAGGATAGLLNLVSARPAMGTVVTLVLVVGIGSWLAELELLRWLDDEADGTGPAARTGGSTEPGGAAWRPGPPGRFAAVGLAALGIGGLVMLLGAAGGGGVGTGWLGLALVLAVIVELAVNAGVLRPALLGQRAAYQTVARPLRVVAHGRSTGDPQADDPPDDDPAWREVVGDLIQTEFWLQTEPEQAELGTVFELDTPVHRQAAARHDSLVRSGLRVVGRSPELRSLRTLRDRQPVIVTVTVDHPPSQLLDRTGRVVGVRRPERRVGRLWLAAGPGGGHRIVESIELGVTPLEHIDGDGDGAGSAAGLGPSAGGVVENGSPHPTADPRSG